MTVPPLTPAAYAQAVREALADLPVAEREEMLEDLDDHLAEVAAEPGMTLEDHLGSPEAYAAELRAAYGGRPARPRRRLGAQVRTRATGLLGTAHARLLQLPPYRQAAAFAPELRPAWWVLRGYAAALLILSGIGPRRLVPGDVVAWVFTLALVWASVWAGRRTVPGVAGWGRAALIAANAVAAIVVLASLADPPMQSSGEVAFDYGVPRPYDVRVEDVATLGGGDVYNIIPYDKDGAPLHDVRLYDQDGRPITTDPESYGRSIAVPCGGEPPMRNAYPLPLTPESPDGLVGEKTPACVMPTPTPSAAVTPSPDGSPSADATGAPSADATPSPGATPSPSVSPSASPSKADGK
ncbi:hypothetical protein GCM10023194_73170 [Planotetraspora phitsanulokensis]|uniref:Proline-rich protein n=1 Tax=Planotetraspora phitsanulokensis TaxID=575192 RepID=A0A8J3U743_9ACTN|nr:hypothetical protein [Planotetraspora phitsanulokensis]GII37184.1 hypothetical protein Pph01_21870 [Planotetraspora phitsanulokensis]